MSLRLGLPLSAAILVADQASKWWILEVARLPEVGQIPVWSAGPFGLDLVQVARRCGVGDQAHLGRVEAKPGQGDRSGDIGVLWIAQRRLPRGAFEMGGGARQMVEIEHRFGG